MGIGDWGLGIGDWDWGLGPIPNPQSPIPNPQSQTIFDLIRFIYFFYIIDNNKLFIKFRINYILIKY